MRGLMNEDMLMDPFLVEMLESIRTDLCQRLIQLEVFEQDGWKVAKFVDMGDQSFLRSQEVSEQVKEARKIARKMGPGKSEPSQKKAVSPYTRKPTQIFQQQQQRYAPYQTQKAQFVDQATTPKQIRCFKCQQIGHFKNQCPLAGGQGKQG
jgi:hypothetical protein